MAVLDTDSPQADRTTLYLPLGILGGLIPGPSQNNQILRYSNPFYKIV